MDSGCAAFCHKDIKQKGNLPFSKLPWCLSEETRTPDLLIRSQTLYPAELPARNVYYNTIRSPNVKAFFQKKSFYFLNWAAGPISGLCACNSGVNVINS